MNLHRSTVLPCRWVVVSQILTVGGLLALLSFSPVLLINCKFQLFRLLGELRDLLVIARLVTVGHRFDWWFVSI